MPVSEIVFDPKLLDGFPNLRGEGMHAASAHVFSIYKSHGRNKDRNGLLHRRITELRNDAGAASEAVEVVPLNEIHKSLNEEVGDEVQGHRQDLLPKRAGRQDRAVPDAEQRG